MYKKKVIYVISLFILIIFLVFLSFIVYNRLSNRYSFENNILNISEKNNKIIFSIDKIVYFSSCNSKSTINQNSNFVLENLYQYTDIAIFLNNNSKEFNEENTLKNLSIKNIKYQTKPEIGNQNLYYKKINDFSKSDFNEENLITDSLNFTISSESETDLNKPTLYNNCSNPISLCYVNSNIKENYAISNVSSGLSYDGSLLKKCNVLLNSLNCSISFDIHITNNLNQEFKTSVTINIPLKDKTTSIYDGNYILKDTTNYLFYRYK